MGIHRFAARFAKLIAEPAAGVFTNLGSSAIDAKKYDEAAWLIAAAAAFTAVKSHAEHVLDEDEKREAIDAFEPLVKQHGSTRGALQALASGKATSPALSAERASDLLTISEQGENAAASPRIEELLLYIGRWIEARASRDDEEWKQFRLFHDDFAADVRAGLDSIQETVTKQAEAAKLSDAEMRSQIALLASSLNAATVAIQVIESDLERSSQLFKKGDFEGVIHIARDLLRRADLSPAQRFSANKLLGNALSYGRDDHKAAATCFLDAKAALPNSEEGRGLETIAELNLGNPEKAQSLAVALCKEHSRSPLGNAVVLRTADQGLKVSELEGLVPSDLLGNPDVAMALAHRAIDLDDLEKAIHYQRIVQASRPEEPTHMAMLGELLLERERRDIIHGLDGEVQLRDPAAVDESIALLTSAIDGLNEKIKKSHVIHLRICRGTAYKMLGKDEDAALDFQWANIEEPTNAEALLQVALKDLGDEHSDLAVSRLRKSVAAQPKSRAVVLLAQTLFDRAAPGDLDEAKLLLAAFIPVASDADEWLRVATSELYFKVLCRGGETDHAVAFLEKLEDGFLPPAVLEGLKSIGAARSADPEAAEKRAKAAATQVTSDTRPEYAAVVAYALTEAGLATEAVAVWKAIANPKHIGPTAFGLIRAAQQAEDDRTILDFIAGLRANGNFSLKLFEIELKLLVHYNALATARAAFAAFMGSEASEKDKSPARVIFSMFAISLGEMDLIERDSSKLPAVAEVDAAEGEAVAHILGISEPTKAVEYAYDLIRRFPAEKAAHRAVIRSFITDSHRKLAIPSSDTVKTDFAVCVAEDGQADKWYTIEAVASSSDSEYLAPTHGYARRMNGLKVGETFALREGHIQPRTGKVTGIIHKTVRRFHRSLCEWDHRFPNDEYIVGMSVKYNDQGEPDLGPMFKTVDARHDRIANLEALVRQGKLPFAGFASATGGTLLEAVEYLCGIRGVPLKCCEGTAEERTAALAVLGQPGTTVVIAPSALAVLFVTGIFRTLPVGHLKFIVSRGSLSEIRRLLVLLRAESSEGGALTKIRGQHVFVPADPVAIAQRRQSLGDFIEWIEKNAEIVDGLPVLDLSAELRKGIHWLGAGFEESVAIAKARQAVLWGDELALGAFAAAQVTVQRVWTQGVATACCAHAETTADVWETMVCSLLEWHQSFTTIRRDTVFFAAERAGWEPWKQPLLSVLDYLTQPQLRLQDLMACWLSLVTAAWILSDEDHARRITLESFNRIAMHPFGRDMIRVVHTMTIEVFESYAHGRIVQALIVQWLKDDKKTVRLKWAL